MRGFRVKKLTIFLMGLLLMTPCMANQALYALQDIAKAREARANNSIKKNDKTAQFSKDYYFVFIYKATCPHCKNFAPTLKSFADNFQMDVDAYSFDGGPIQEFKSKPLTSELFKTFYVDSNYKPTVPALFLVNKHTSEAYAVLFGEAEPYELSNRMNKLVAHIEERFHV